MKDMQLLCGGISNKNKPFQIADSKIKRQLKIFDDNGDADKLVTNLANVINFELNFLVNTIKRIQIRIFTYLQLLVTTAQRWVGQSS